MEKNLRTLIADKIQDCFGGQARLKSLLPLAGDASARRYHRALLGGKGLPTSIVIMELGGRGMPLSSEELAVFKEPPRELPFLNLHRFLSKLDVRVPALYGHWVGDGILLLEDLGDHSLCDSVQGLSMEEISRWYERALDQLLILQIHGTRERDDSCIAFQQRFDYRLYMWEFEHFIEYGIENGEKGTMDNHERDILTAAFAAVSRQLERQPLYLSHRDYHGRNLMVSREELVIIDFQDALLAPIQYDLASLLNDREAGRLIGPDLEQHLIGYYLRRRDEMGEPKLQRDEFMENYLLSALQRDFKVIGRFIYLDLIKGKSEYRRYLPMIVRRLQRNLAKHPGLKKLLPVLSPHLQEIR